MRPPNDEAGPATRPAAATNFTDPQDIAAGPAAPVNATTLPKQGARAVGQRPRRLARQRRRTTMELDALLGVERGAPDGDGIDYRACGLDLDVRERDLFGRWST